MAGDDCAAAYGRYGAFGIGTLYYSMYPGTRLGVCRPGAIVSGALLIRRKPFGYLLASVIITKVIAMLTAVTAMAIGMVLAGVKVDLAQMLLFMLLFPLFNLVAIYCLVLIMKNIKEVGYKE